jgi:hypothetical protein
MRARSAVVALLVLAVSGRAGAQDASAATRSLLEATFGKLPLYFVENRGVYPEEVKYYIQGSDKTLFFTTRPEAATQRHGLLNGHGVRPRALDLGTDVPKSRSGRRLARRSGRLLRGKTTSCGLVVRRTGSRSG